MIWEYDKKTVAKMKKENPKWYLERCIMYGLPKGEKLNKTLLQKYLPTLNIPQNRRDFLELLCE